MSETVTEAPPPSPSTPTPEFDYSSLLAKADPVQPPTPEPAPEPAPEAHAEPPEPEPAKEPEAPREGTPDKWRQHVDQRLSAIEKLAEKVESGEATPKEIAKLAEQKSALDELLKEGREADPFNDQPKIVKHILDSEKTRAEREKAIDERLAQLEEENRALKSTQIWEAQTREYPGVDVKKIWTDATKDAATAVERKLTAAGIQMGKEQIAQLCYAEALEVYAKRAGEASKSVAARNGKPTTPEKTAPKPPSKPTPAAARVQVSGSPSSAPKPSEINAITDQDYRNLLVE